MNRIPPAVNFHLWKPCNLRCRFCYAHFDDDLELQRVRGGLPESECRRVLEALRHAGAKKITFVGGEPTLCPYLPKLLVHAQRLGFVNTLVTNGARLSDVLERAPDTVDWAGLSVDSADELTQAKLGRGKGDHVRRSRECFRLLHSLGIRVKLNTVVTSLNWREDMGEFVRETRPERWKVFQVLPIEGQNDGSVESLLISHEQFRDFVDRHRHLESTGLVIAAESNDDMTGSYAMVDPLGRFFGNSGGRYTYSRPILEVGVEAAFSEIEFELERFNARGGEYEWASPAVDVTVLGKPRQRQA